MTEIELSYIAGLIDGEGYIGIKKTKPYRCQQLVSYAYHARIQIRMVEEQAIKFVAECFGGWYYKEKPHVAKGRLLYCYSTSDKNAEKVLTALLPYLRVKKAVARIVLRYRRLQNNCRKYQTKITGYRNFPNSYGKPRRVANKSFSDKYNRVREKLYWRCRHINTGK